MVKQHNCMDSDMVRHYITLDVSRKLTEKSYINSHSVYN